MAYYNLSRFEQGVSDGTLVYKLRPNEKTLYRKVVNAESLILQRMGALIRLQSLSAAQKAECEKLLVTATELKAELAELAEKDPANKKLAEINARHSKTLDTLQKLLKSESQPPKKEAVAGSADGGLKAGKKVAAEASRPAPLEKSKLLEVANDITKKGIKNILESSQMPQSSAEFETLISSFKDEHRMLFDYLNKVSVQVFAKFYSTRQIEIRYILKIFKSLELVAKDLSVLELRVVFDVLRAVSQTSKISLSCKMMLEREKDLIRKLINKSSEALANPDEKEELFKAYAL